MPSDTPADPNGVRVIPSAGPYRVASYTPGQGVVLTRNPNYHGSRPHRLARIELAVGSPRPARRRPGRRRATADYAVDGGVTGCRRRQRSPRATAREAQPRRTADQQYFVNAGPQLDFFALNTHRPLFADARLRQAVNYAINRAALARLGDEYTPLLPEPPTDHYLPPGIPGYRNVQHLPAHPGPGQSADSSPTGAAGRTAVLYTCNVSPCDQQAQIIKTDLAAIGLRVEVKAFPDSTLYTKTATPGEPFDIAYLGWLPDYHDPGAILNVLLEGGADTPDLRRPDLPRAARRRRHGSPAPSAT